MADFSHLGVVNTEIRSNTPIKAFDKEEPQLDQGAFPGKGLPGFAAVALPGMSGRESPALSKKELKEQAKDNAKRKKEDEKAAKQAVKDAAVSAKREEKAAKDREKQREKDEAAAIKEAAWIQEQNDDVLKQRLAAKLEEQGASGGEATFVGSNGTNRSQPPWLWVPCVKEDANAAVTAAATGDFLVRASSKPGCFVLMVSDGGDMQQLQISGEAGKHEIAGAIYASLPDIINQYQYETKLNSKTGGESFNLGKGIPSLSATLHHYSPSPDGSPGSRPTTGVFDEADLAGYNGAAPSSWGVTNEDGVVLRREPGTFDGQPQQPGPNHKMWQEGEEEGLGFGNDWEEKATEITNQGWKADAAIERPGSVFDGFERRLSTYSGFGDDLDGDEEVEEVVVIPASIFTAFKNADPHESGYISVSDFFGSVLALGHLISKQDNDEICATVINDRIHLEDFAKRLRASEVVSAKNIKGIFNESHEAMGGMLPANAVRQILLAVVGCDILESEFAAELAAYESNTGYAADLFPPLETIFIAQNTLKRNRARTLKKFTRFDAALIGTLPVGRLLVLLRENNHDVGDSRFQGMLGMLNLTPSQSLDRTMFVLAYEALVKANFDYVPMSPGEYNVEQDGASPELEQDGASPEVIDIDTTDPELADIQAKVEEKKAAKPKKAAPATMNNTGPEEWDTKPEGLVHHAKGPGVETDRHLRMSKQTAVSGTGKMHRAEFKGGEYVGVETAVDTTAQPIVRAKKQSKRLFGIRKVNEQVISENVGQKTKLDTKSEFIDREQKAQRIASKREGGLVAFPPGSHGGEFKRSGADISYFNGNDRDLQPVGTLDYSPPAEGEQTIIPLEISLDTNLMSAFFHPYLHTKKEATQMLKMSGKDGVFLVRPERHGGVDQPCISVCMKKKVTHHILSNAGFGTDYVLSCYPFKMKNVTLLGCNTVPLVLEHLRKKYDYWHAPLTVGVNPAKEDVQDYVETTLVEQTAAEATAREEAHNDTVINDHIPITAQSSPYNVVNSRAKDVSPEKKRQQFVINKARQSKLAAFADNNHADLGFTVGATKKNRPVAARILVQAPVSLVSGGFVNFNAPTAHSHSSRENSRPVSRAATGAPILEVEGDEAVAASTDIGQELVNVPEPIEVDQSVAPFNHGEIDKDAAEVLLFADGGDKTTGKFLFREAKGKPGEYILSVVYKGKGTHHAVATNEEGFLTINKMASDKTAFDEFIEYLGKKQKAVKWPVPLVEGVPGAAEAAQAAQADAIAAATAANETALAEAAAAAEAAAEAADVVEEEPAAPVESAAAARRRKNAEAEEKKALQVPVVNDTVAFTRSRSSMRHASVANKQFSNINQGASEVPTQPADTVDVSRSGFAQKTAWKSKRQFSNITAGAAKHNVKMDGEAIQREVKAQNVVADILRHDKHTGSMRKDGENADASFFTRTATVKDELGATDNRVASARNIVAQHGGFKKIEKPLLQPKVSIRDRMAALNPTSSVVSRAAPNIKPDAAHVAPAELMSVETANDADALAMAEAAEGLAKAQAAKDAAAAVTAAANAEAAAVAAKSKEAADAQAAASAAAVPAEELDIDLTDPEPEPEAAVAEVEAEAAPEPEPEPEPESSGEFEFLHTGLNKADADALLLADDGAKTTGKYLIRQTEAGSGKYVLSVIYKGKSTHHVVSTTEQGTLALNGADSKLSDMAEFATYLGEKRKAIKWPVPLVQGVPPSGGGSEDVAADNSGGDDSTAEVAAPAGELFQYLHAVTKGDAEVLLMEDGGAEVSGKFLVRQTGQLGDEEPESAILSVVYRGKATHHAIAREEGGFLSLNKKISECKTLEELTTFCQAKQKSIGWPVPLVQGVARS